MLTLAEYQAKARETAIYPPRERIIYPTLGLVSEAGEVAGKLKKVLRDDDSSLTDEKQSELAKEIGDVLWYCAALATDLGLSLERIAQDNLDKLSGRKARGTLQGSGDDR